MQPANLGSPGKMAIKTECVCVGSNVPVNKFNAWFKKPETAAWFKFSKNSFVLRKFLYMEVYLCTEILSFFQGVLPDMGFSYQRIGLICMQTECHKR